MIGPMATGLLLPLVPAAWACLAVHGFRSPEDVPRTALNLSGLLLAALLLYALGAGGLHRPDALATAIVGAWALSLLALMLGHVAGALRRR